MVKYVVKYSCPYCGNTFPHEYQAEECAKECAPVDGIDIVNVIACEMCGETFEYEQDAENCEFGHKEKDDQLYQKYLVRKNFESLAKAASLPGQTKLGG